MFIYLEGNVTDREGGIKRYLQSVVHTANDSNDMGLGWSLQLHPGLSWEWQGHKEQCPCGMLALQQRLRTLCHCSSPTPPFDSQSSEPSQAGARRLVQGSWADGRNPPT